MRGRRLPSITGITLRLVVTRQDNFRTAVGKALHAAHWGSLRLIVGCSRFAASVSCGGNQRDSRRGNFLSLPAASRDVVCKRPVVPLLKRELIAGWAVRSVFERLSPCLDWNGRSIEAKCI
jgi:hypothetical protein